MSRVVVTGGSSGIGHATVRALAAAGHDVAVLSRRAPEGVGAGVVFESVDLVDLERGIAALGKVADALGGVDALVNCAGAMEFGAAHEQTPEAIRHHLLLDLAAPIALSGTAMRRMIEAKTGGHIVNIGSVAGLKPTPKLSAYAAAKAGLVHFTRCLAAEGAVHGVRANAVCPGAAATNLTSRPMFALIERGIPLKKLQTADEIAALIVWLLSDAAKSMTGSVVSLDGGMSL